MNELESLLNTEVDKVSFSKTTGDKSPEEYLINVLLLVKSKRTLDDYQIILQDSNSVTFGLIKEIG